MEIKSLTYVGFVAVFLIIYFLLQKTGFQKWVILAADLFVVWRTTGLRSLLIAMAVVAVVYGAALQIESGLTTGRKRAAHGWMIFGAVVDISVLLFFKYFSGFYEHWQFLMSQKGFTLISLTAPVGLSYYILSLYAYLYDVYHGKHGAEHQYLNLLSFALFFPAVVEGPFNLYQKLMPQLEARHSWDSERVVLGLQRILWGYIEKVVIADRIGIIVTSVLGNAPDTEGGFTIFWTFVLYSFQIYGDFAGGIDVIMGISECMGIMLPENFRSPLVSKSVTEFWQRWHMTLGTIMEKYVYYPIVLGKRTRIIARRIHNKYMSRVFAAALASFVVFVLVGIWHGTGWNYVVYGLYQAFWVTMAVLLKPFWAKSKARFHVNEECLSWKIFTVLRTFVILVFGRYLTRSANLAQAFSLYDLTFHPKGEAMGIHILFDGTLELYGLDQRNMILMYAGILLLIVVDVLHEKGFHFRRWIMKQDIVFRYAVWLCALFCIIILGVYGYGYEASSFIYAQY